MIAPTMRNRHRTFRGGPRAGWAVPGAALCPLKRQSSQVHSQATASRKDPRGEWRPSRRVTYIFLFATLVGGYFFPFEAPLGLSLPLRLAAAGLVVGLPIGWASIIFSISFREATQTSRVFGSNLLGVVCGGCLEYLSSLWGLNTLYLIALVLHLASGVFLLRGRSVGGH